MKQAGTDRYDVAICSDMLEHLKKVDGRILLHYMWLAAKKRIVFTPIGEYNLTDDDNPDSHRSGWTADDFKNYATIAFPQFHPQLNVGAFFAFHCSNLEQEFERVKNELKNKSWAR